MMKYTGIKNLASATKWVGNRICELSMGRMEAETWDLSLLQGVLLEIFRKNIENQWFSMFSQDDETYMYQKPCDRDEMGRE